MFSSVLWLFKLINHTLYPISIAVVTVEDIKGKIPYVLNPIRSLQDLIFFNFGGTIMIQWQICELILDASSRTTVSVLKMT